MSEKQAGVVKWFDSKKGYGFITPDNGGKDVFVHFASIKGDGFKTLNDGDKVEYTATEGKKGMEAQNVSRIGGDSDSGYSSKRDRSDDDGDSDYSSKRSKNNDND
ncbi:MAG: cold-shock protein [Gammaproteobacteria bacterium]|nr:cold-shock protein [Gammaproteobacteria bacterium]